MWWCFIDLSVVLFPLVSTLVILSASVDAVCLHIYRLRFTRDSCWSWRWFHRLSNGKVVSYSEDHQGVWYRPRNEHRFGIFIKLGINHSCLQRFAGIWGKISHKILVFGPQRIIYERMPLLTFINGKVNFKEHFIFIFIGFKLIKNMVFRP